MYVALNYQVDFFGREKTMSDENPCRMIDYGDGRFGVIFDDFGPTQDLLEEKEFEGGGYTWHGIVEALVRLYHPDLAKELEFDPESSMFVARSANEQALHQVAELIQRAQNDPEVLQQAIDNADPSIIE